MTDPMKGKLRQALDAAIAEAKANGGGKLTLNDLTVQAPEKDPFRMDTPTNHKLARWLKRRSQPSGWVRRRRSTTADPLPDLRPELQEKGTARRTSTSVTRPAGSR